MVESGWLGLGVRCGWRAWVFGLGVRGVGAKVAESGWLAGAGAGAGGSGSGSEGKRSFNMYC